jgi:hypothetical protein
MSAAQNGAYTPPDGAFRQAATASSTALLAPMAAPRTDGSPLLVLDAGAFLTRCRRCGWTSPRQATPKAAWAAFESHSCEERPA